MDLWRVACAGSGITNASLKIVDPEQEDVQKDWLQKQIISYIYIFKLKWSFKKFFFNLETEFQTIPTWVIYTYKKNKKLQKKTKFFFLFRVGQL